MHTDCRSTIVHGCMYSHMLCVLTRMYMYYLCTYTTECTTSAVAGKIVHRSQPTKLSMARVFFHCGHTLAFVWGHLGNRYACAIRTQLFTIIYTTPLRTEIMLHISYVRVCLGAYALHLRMHVFTAREVAVIFRKSRNFVYTFFEVAVVSLT